MTDNEIKEAKKKALAYYEEGKIDEAIEALKGVPMDEEVRELHRALRYADEARGIRVLPPRYDDGPAILKPE